jgi:hypothetical protein
MNDSYTSKENNVNPINADLHKPYSYAQMKKRRKCNEYTLQNKQPNSNININHTNNKETTKVDKQTQLHCKYYNNIHKIVIQAQLCT